MDNYTTYELVMAAVVLVVVFGAIVATAVLVGYLKYWGDRRSARYRVGLEDQAKRDLVNYR